MAVDFGCEYLLVLVLGITQVIVLNYNNNNWLLKRMYSSRINTTADN